MLLKIGLASDVNDEVISIKLLDVGDALIFFKQFTQVILDSAQLLHDFIPEVAFSLFVGLLELDNHELSHGLELINRAGLAFRDLRELLALDAVFERNLSSRQSLIRDSSDHNRTITAGSVHKLPILVDGNALHTLCVGRMSTESETALVLVKT